MPARRPIGSGVSYRRGVAGDHERVQIESRRQWRAWLEANHGSGESIWLVRFKKSADPARHVSYDDVVEEALCFGWADSLPRKLDAERSMLRLSPRKPGSAWSAPNKRRVAAMTAAGRMRPAGLAKVEAAKADGAWTFLDDVERLQVPDDLAAALGADRPAWDALTRTVRRGELERIKQAKRPATRAKRIAEAAALAAG